MTLSAQHSFIALLLSLIIFAVVTSCKKSPPTQSPGEEIPQPASINADLDDTIVLTPLPVDTIKESEIEKEKLLLILTDETQELLNFMNESVDSAKYATGILHRMAYDSPEYTLKLLKSSYPNFIIVDKQAMQLALFDKYGREELRYGIACGKNFGTKVKKGDCRTSEGFFSAEGIYNSTDWLYTDDNGVTSQKKGQFGPRFIRLEIPNTRAIGIHGTCAPGSIGRRTSHGCIRVKNENILELVKHVEVGMPIIVSPSDRDVSVNKKEDRYIAQVTINPKSNHNSTAKKTDGKNSYDYEKIKEEVSPVEMNLEEDEEKVTDPEESITLPSSPEEYVEEQDL